MMVYVRPSNEHILIVRVPGAQDQRGRPSPFCLSNFAQTADGPLGIMIRTGGNPNPPAS